MHRCYHCGSKFGLISHRLVTLSGYLRFCRRSCKEAYQKLVQEEIRNRQFHTWLKTTGR
jgi:hypothetical protein